jgi:ubiquinone/menaquinone biosynthesis C-methylase UbiE
LPRARHGEGRNPHAHPWFACLYGVLARVAEKGELCARRRALLASAEGRVLELGAGTGENFKHYPPQVTEVVAVEPDPHMRRQAARRIGEAAMAVELVDATGEDLPLEPSSFDTVVATLVLCSVDDPERTLSELRRVLRPGGQLMFLEHVRARTEGLARWQDRLERPWMVVGGGCRPNRETGDAIGGNGFRLRDLETFDLRPSLPLVRPHVQGVAVAV